jgi:hypothetical protein
MKKETSELLQDAIASTLLQSGNCRASSSSYSSSSTSSSSCPYSDVAVTIERVEWARSSDPVTLRFYAVATFGEDYAAARSGSTAFDTRQELDAFVLDYFYGDLFFAALSAAAALSDGDADEDDDPVLGRARSSAAQLMVSDSQSRIYRTRSPGASALAVSLLFLALLFAADGAARYLTPLRRCARSGNSVGDDGSDDESDEADERWGGAPGPRRPLAPASDGRGSSPNRSIV